MRIDQIIPLGLTAQMFAAAVVCAVCRRWLDVVYWAGGGLLNLSIFLRG